MVKIMQEWKKLTFQDQPLINQALKKCPLHLSDYPFTNLWMWDELRNYHYAVIGEAVCLKFNEESQLIYLFPVGEKAPLKSIEILFKEHPSGQSPFKMRAIPEEEIDSLKKLSFKTHIQEEENRFDYIYLFDDLLHLKGNRYQAKRNLIYQFERAYEYEYKELNGSLIPLVIAMEDKWFEKHKHKGHHIEWEYRAVRRALENYDKLPLKGGALLVEGNVIAFSFAELISKDMWLVHAEKADESFKGAYQTLAEQLIQHLAPAKFVNKEESLGIESLIKMKNSYHPVLMVKKYVLTS